MMGIIQKYEYRLFLHFIFEASFVVYIYFYIYRYIYIYIYIYIYNLILVKPLFNTTSFLHSNIILFYFIKLISLPFGYCFNDYFQIIFIYQRQLLRLVKSLQVMALHCIWRHGMNCTFLVTPFFP